MNGGWGVSDGAVAVPSVGQSRELGAVAGCCSDENEFLCGNSVRCPGAAGRVPASDYPPSFVIVIIIHKTFECVRNHNPTIGEAGKGMQHSNCNSQLFVSFTVIAHRLFFLKDVTSLIDEFGSGAPRTQRARGCPGIEVGGVMSRVKAAHT